MKMSVGRSRLSLVLVVAAAISAMTSTGACSGIQYGPFELGPGPDRPPPEYELDDVAIMVDRHGCYEGCPSYSVQISGNGHVVYEGVRHVAEEGIHESWIDPDTVGDLVDDFVGAGFFDRRVEDAPDVGTGPRDGPRMALSGLNASGCIDFGAVDAGSTVEEDLGIHSIGGTPLHIYSVYATCPAVGIRSINALKQDIGYAMQPLELAQGESLDLRVVVHVDSSPELSPRLCWLLLQTSDPANFAENDTRVCVTFDPE